MAYSWLILLRQSRQSLRKLDPAADSGLLLGQLELQNAVFKAGGHAVLLDALQLEAALHGADPALPAQVLLFLILVLLPVLGGDGQNAVLDLQLDLLLGTFSGNSIFYTKGGATWKKWRSLWRTAVRRSRA